MRRVERVEWRRMASCTRCGGPVEWSFTTTPGLCATCKRSIPVGANPGQMTSAGSSPALAPAPASPAPSPAPPPALSPPVVVVAPAVAPAVAAPEAAPRRSPLLAVAVAGGILAITALTFIVRPWPTPTPIAVVPAPSLAPSVPPPATTVTPAPTPPATTAKPAPTPPATPKHTTVAVRATPKPTGDHPGARFGARPSPNLADPRFLALEEGHRLLDQRQTADAVVKYKELTLAHATFPDGYYWYGYASAIEGDAEGACTGFHRYVRLAPNGYYAKGAREQVVAFCAAME